jgi:uncharacterized protein YybS (DUF2232 family)
LPSADLETLAQGIRQAGDLITRIFPSLLVVSLASIAILNVMALFKFTGRWLTSLPEPDKFQAYRNPELFVWVVIIAGFSMFLPQPAIRGAALNILVVSGFIYFLQGLAVILSYFQRLAVPSLARFFFWLVLMFQPYFVLAISFLGIFDLWADFRSPKQKNL